MASKPQVDCKRPYALGKRAEASDRVRAAIVTAAREELEANGYANFTMELLARESGVSRQTVHNLFGTKLNVLEALFDHLAQEGGMDRMHEVMQQKETDSMLREFVRVIVAFWSKHRTLIRRIHAIAALDQEFAPIVQSRNRRRKMAAGRVLERMGMADRTGLLFALTSFEFFDALFAESIESEQAWPVVLDLVLKALP